MKDLSKNKIIYEKANINNINDIYNKHCFKFVRNGKSYYDYTLREYKINSKEKKL